MSPKLKEVLLYSADVILLNILLVVALLVLSGCGAHQRAAMTPVPGPETAIVQEPASGGSSLTFQTTNSTPAVLSPVYFDFDRHDIRLDQRPALSGNADAIQAGALVTLEGHCDERGTESYNLALGLRRAYAVRRYLLDLGVGAEFRCVSLGEDRPADPGHDEAAWARNRRVEFR